MSFAAKGAQFPLTSFFGNASSRKRKVREDSENGQGSSPPRKKVNQNQNQNQNAAGSRQQQVQPQTHQVPSPRREHNLRQQTHHHDALPSSLNFAITPSPGGSGSTKRQRSQHRPVTSRSGSRGKIRSPSKEPVALLTPPLSHHVVRRVSKAVGNGKRISSDPSSPPRTPPKERKIRESATHVPNQVQLATPGSPTVRSSTTPRRLLFNPVTPKSARSPKLFFGSPDASRDIVLSSQTFRIQEGSAHTAGGGLTSSTTQIVLSSQTQELPTTLTSPNPSYEKLPTTPERRVRTKSKEQAFARYSPTRQKQVGTHEFRKPVPESSRVSFAHQTQLVSSSQTQVEKEVVPRGLLVSLQPSCSPPRHMSSRHDNRTPTKRAFQGHKALSGRSREDFLFRSPEQPSKSPKFLESLPTPRTPCRPRQGGSRTSHCWTSPARQSVGSQANLIASSSQTIPESDDELIARPGPSLIVPSVESSPARRLSMRWSYRGSMTEPESDDQPFHRHVTRSVRRAPSILGVTRMSLLSLKAGGGEDDSQTEPESDEDPESIVPEVASTSRSHKPGRGSQHTSKERSVIASSGDQFAGHPAVLEPGGTKRKPLTEDPTDTSMADPRPAVLHGASSHSSSGSSSFGSQLSSAPSAVRDFFEIFRRDPIP